MPVQQPKSPRPESHKRGFAPSETVFRSRYKGKTLAVVGGREKEDQIHKLGKRLGLRVRWFETDVSKNHSAKDAIVCRLKNTPFDFVLVFVRSMSHGVFDAVKLAVRQINDSHGYKRTIAVPSNTFNTEDIARRFLRFAPEEVV